jgi:hypothetical protein
MMLPLTLKTARVLEEAFEQQRERLKLERLEKIKNKNMQQSGKQVHAEMVRLADVKYASDERFKSQFIDIGVKL